MDEERGIDLVYKKCKDIIEEKYKNDVCKPTFMISQMYESGYVLTLLHSKNDKAFGLRQSAFINLDTDLLNTIELLYNRTM